MPALGLGISPVFQSGLVSTYIQKVLSIEPADLIAFWPLNETSGTTAEDQIDSPAQDGTYTGVTLDSISGPDGSPAGFWDGTNDHTAIYSANFDAALDGDEGTAAIYFKAFDAGVWTDANPRKLLHFYADANNYIVFQRKAANGELRIWRKGSASSKFIDITGLSSTAWNHLAMTWSLSAGATGEAKVYMNGAQQGATLTNIGAWAGALHTTRTRIGSYDQVPTNPWHGYLSLVPVWTTRLSDDQILELATI